MSRLTEQTLSPSEQKEVDYYNRLTAMPPGVVLWMNHIPLAEHGQFLSILKTFIAGNIFWDEGFQIELSADEKRFRKIAVRENIPLAP